MNTTTYSYMNAFALGSVIAVLDDRGNVVQSMEYSAFGESISGGDSVTPFRFVGGLGGRTDDATGLVYFWNRWYDPQTGRWLSEDPMRQRGGVNLYGYVGNNPAVSIDTNGLVIKTEGDSFEQDMLNGALNAYRNSGNILVKNWINEIDWSSVVISVKFGDASAHGGGETTLDGRITISDNLLGCDESKLPYYHSGSLFSKGGLQVNNYSLIGLLGHELFGHALYIVRGDMELAVDESNAVKNENVVHGAFGEPERTY